jgi:hypothetical protein
MKRNRGPTAGAWSTLSFTKMGRKLESRRTLMPVPVAVTS